jgi:vacuolar-type H+-ATPase subunit C/Vma6
MSSGSTAASDLVRRDASDGFPTDYLLARIKGRRSALVADWRGLIAAGLPPGASDERIWEALLRELEWLHGQMNPALREAFAPLFGLFEIKTIVLCLRNRGIGRTAEIERLLERSLLAEPLQAILRRPADVRSAVAALAGAMGGPRQTFRELEAAYADARSRGFENALMRLFLEQMAGERLDAVVRTFFVLFTDLRNVMLLYKRLRWGIGGDGAFIIGGSVPPSRLHEILSRTDAAAFDDLVADLTGLERASAAASEGSLETLLLRNITERLEKLARQSDDTGTIVVYIWHTYVQARNLAVLHHGRGLDVETLERELIL